MSPAETRDTERQPLKLAPDDAKQAEPTVLNLFKRPKKNKLDEIATQPSFIDDPEKAKFNQPSANMRICIVSISPSNRHGARKG